MSHKDFHEATFCPEGVGMKHAYEARLKNLRDRIESLEHLAGELRVSPLQAHPGDTSFIYTCTISPLMFNMDRHGFQNEEIEYVASMHAGRLKCDLSDAIKRVMRRKREGL